MAPNVMLNSESVILNLVQNLFRAGLVQHPCLRQAGHKINVLNQVQDLRP